VGVEAGVVEAGVVEVGVDATDGDDCPAKEVVIAAPPHAEMSRAEAVTASSPATGPRDRFTTASSARRITRV
jgi:hypothetical protein